ncbi:MAG: hypothetical protein J0H25_17470 [Rhizobiales bacterium]|nr:hypothetical protein [Hyphomicrobiales bacterium]
MNGRYVDASEIDALANSVGITIPPDRQEIVAQRLNEMHALAAEFASLDVSGCDPAFAYDAAWPEEAEQA